jgi:hypothetical protein
LHYSRNVSYEVDRLKPSPDSNSMVEGGRTKQVLLTFVAKVFEGPKLVFLLLESKGIPCDLASHISNIKEIDLRSTKRDLYCGLVVGILRFITAYCDLLWNEQYCY